MIIKTLSLDKNHWSTEWIPISYELSIINYNKSLTLLWEGEKQVYGLCRAYFISETNIEIGDLWINNIYRGRNNTFGVKYSIEFLENTIFLIWNKFKSAKVISLIVDSQNIQALKLYEKLNFKKIKTICCKTLNINKGIYMELAK